MRIMAKHATNRVNTIKLPGGQYTQTRRETQKELFRVHFPDSKLIDVSRTLVYAKAQRKQGRLEPGQQANNQK
jgi:hypothetical protein